MRKLAEDSVAKKTIEFINEFPFIIHGLRKNLINYSSLARFIQRETGIKNFDAILVALRRYQRRVRSVESGKKIMDLFRKSRMEIRTGVCLYRLMKLDPELIQGLKHFNLLYDEYGAIELVTDEKMKITPLVKNLLEVKIKSPPEVDTIPGVMSHICSTLAGRGINIIKTYFNSNTIFFVFEKKDLSRVVAALESIGIQ